MASPSFEQVTPHIYKLDLPMLGGKLPVGVWLVRDETGWVMVDAGGPGFEEAVLKQVLACTGEQHPYMLVLTHGHGDHAAAAQRIRELWKIPVAAGRDEIPFLVGPARYASIKARNPLYKLLQISGPQLLGRNVQRPLDEGMQLGDMRVYHVPGHAPGMVALLHPADRALICADTFYNLSDRLRDPASVFTYDPALNHQSQTRLAQLDFDHLLPSHGPVILREGKARVQELLAKRQSKTRADKGTARRATA
jgi:glyoxylase-like metal-dependent hydrolase (beta-lactamase superfamily II)